ncbi:hypothetical protein [Puniceicoccus vermicola]|uniref:SLA1 homology domain-containing protein n=1 Tax=Puniceicoccus vermicola TaxID=388746 RepID=A0A7X1AX20_9BACT|nr:hypothetical protein [Puniceicoccus vermicola]MBC2601546.1 hypothetical protein [Puniceicoccus vermicola]
MDSFGGYTHVYWFANQLLGLMMVSMRLGRLLPIFCGLVILGGFSTLLGTEVRTFTNNEGQSIQASLESVDDTYVEIRREDGRRFTIPLQTLSREDQEYVKKWVSLQAISDERLFEISAKRLDENETKSTQTGLDIEERDGFYEITLENRTGTNLNDLEVRWAIRVEKTAAGEVHDRKADLWTKGRIKDVDLSDREEKELETGRVLLREVKVQSGYRWASNAPKNARDKLDGLYVAIFLDGMMIREYSLPSGLLEEGRDAMRLEEQEKLLFGR